jgi:hypothetical protein
LKDDIKINSKYIGLEGVDWIHLGQDKALRQAVVNMATNVRIP